MLTWYLNGKKLSKIDLELKNQKLILFGADEKRNEQLFNEIDKKDIIYIFDNNSQKWGSQQEGISIVEPFRIEEEVVLISGVYDWKTISNQIKEMGYCKIFFFLTEKVENLVGKYISEFSPDIYNNAICQNMIFTYIHFIPDEKFFAPVIEYIEYGLNVREHFFVVYGMNNGNCNDIYGIWDKYKKISDEYNNIYLCHNECYRLNLWDWEDNRNQLEILLEEAEKIIFHGETLTPLIYKFFLGKIDLVKKKGVLIPWSGEIGRNEYTNPIIERLLQHVKMIPYAYPIDKRTMISYFPLMSNSIWVKSKVSYARLTEYIPRQKECVKNILVAHSPHDYTRVKETLEYLRDLQQPVCVYCVTSYGPQEEIEEVEKRGKNYFGERFFSIRKYMDYKEYVGFLSRMDVAVFGMETLSGRDTLEILFWLGKKVYLKEGEEACIRMQAAGYRVNDYYAAKQDLMAGKFDNVDEEWNHSIAENEFNPKKKLEQWRELFEYNFDEN